MRIIKFELLDTEISDEETRLKSTTLFDIFRLIISLYDVKNHPSNALFFGGLFSYELIIQFENIPIAPANSNCPDLCFYLAESLISFDHQQGRSELQITLFSNSKDQQQRLAKLPVQQSIPPNFTV